MPQLRSYKFLVMPVLQLVDDDGAVVGEQQPQQPDHVFGVEGLHTYADGFEEALQRLEAANTNGGGVPVAR